MLLGVIILPDGATVKPDASGGFTLPNGAQATPDGAGGLTLPNGARCSPDGAWTVSEQNRLLAVCFGLSAVNKA
jgi:hypothetical protein